MEVRRCRYLVRRYRSGDDMGAVEQGFYVLDEERRIVTLTDQQGTPLMRPRKARGDPKMRYERRLRADENTRLAEDAAASALLGSRYGADKRGSDFSRPLSYPAGSVA